MNPRTTTKIITDLETQFDEVKLSLSDIYGTIGSLDADFDELKTYVDARIDRLSDHIDTKLD
jgi:hypothetical protein